MNPINLFFFLALTGCATGDYKALEVNENVEPKVSSITSFAEFIKSADLSAERTIISPLVVAGSSRGDGFAISRAYVTDTNDLAYYFDDNVCVNKPSLAEYLNRLGYVENTDRLPNSERSLDTYAVYSKPKAQINVEFSIKAHKQCLWALFIKYK